MTATDAAHVYMLRCADGRYYVGSTRATLERRLAEHNAGTFDGWTARRRPVTLVWSQEFQQITDAIAFERRLKGWSRAKKAALIAGDYDLLHEIARYRPRAERASVVSSPADPSLAVLRTAAQDEVEA